MSACTCADQIAAIGRDKLILPPFYQRVQKMARLIDANVASGDCATNSPQS